MLRKLKQLRQEYGISQQRLADAIGVSQPSINKYENHNIEPDIEILIRIADYFDTSIDFLVERTEVRHVTEYTEEFSLSPREIKLITKFRKLNTKEKECIDIVITNLMRE